MSNLNIETWFPRPIGYVDNVCSDQRSSILSHVNQYIDREGTHRDGGLWVDSTHKIHDQLHLDRALDGLVRVINDYASVFLVAQGWTDEAARTVVVAQMWANRSGGNDYLFPHVHPGSLLSGAYYLSALDPVSSITFFRDLGYMFPEVNSPGNMFSDETCSYQCAPGRLLLFRSDFMHGCKISPGAGAKVVLSFNLVKSVTL